MSREREGLRRSNRRRTTYRSNKEDDLNDSNDDLDDKNDIDYDPNDDDDLNDDDDRRRPRPEALSFSGHGAMVVVLAEG